MKYGVRRHPSRGPDPVPLTGVSSWPIHARPPVPSETWLQVLYGWTLLEALNWAGSSEKLNLMVLIGVEKQAGIQWEKSM
jgi:hypothetical protein